MSKMNRATFVQAIDDLWGIAQGNFAKHGQIYTHLVALNATGHQIRFLDVPANAHEEALAHGAIPITGSWPDQRDGIQAAFELHKAVAAVFVGEAWTVDDEDAWEAMRSNESLAVHPRRQEMIFVMGFWPREFVATGFRAFIERDSSGAGRLVRHQKMDEREGSMVASWVEEILPQAH